MPRTVADFGGEIAEASLSVLLELWTILGAYRVEELRSEDYRRLKGLCDRYADADILTLVERLPLSRVRSCQRHRLSCTANPGADGSPILQSK